MKTLLFCRFRVFLRRIVAGQPHSRQDERTARGGCPAALLRVQIAALVAIGCALVAATPALAAPGSAVDSGFESGSDGAGLGAAWALSGAPQHAEYDTARAKVGFGSAWIQGPASATNAGVFETASGGMTSDGSEVRFWVYMDNATSSRMLEDYAAGVAASDRAFSINFAGNGRINVLTDRASVNGYPRAVATPVGLYKAGWTQYRIVFNFSGQTFQLSARENPGDPWTQLKALGASGYDIPFRGASTITRSHGTLWRGYQNAQMWLDDLRYADAGIDSTPPSTSLAFLASDHPADQGGSIDLLWSACADDEGVAGYKLLRGTSPGAYTQTWTLSAGGSSFTDDTAVLGTRYYYTVRAVDGAGNEGGLSAEASAISQDNLAPAVPQGLSASGGSRQASLSWTANAEPDFFCYDIYRDGGFLSSVTGASSTTYTDKSLGDGTPYAYQVRARDNHGNASALCATVTARTASTSGGALVDNGFESRANGSSLDSGIWTSNGAPQVRAYSWSRAKGGSQSAQIQGPTTSTNAGVGETTSAGMTSNGAELRFWLYFDTNNQSRLLDDYAPGVATADRAACIQFAADGRIKAQTDRSGISGYPAGTLTEIGRYETGWTEFQIIYTFTGAGAQTYTLSKRSASTDPWTPLKASSATSANIPFRGTNTITRTHGTLWRCLGSSQIWLDELMFSDAGIRIDGAPPSKPGNLVAADRPNDQGGAIDLTWSAATDNVAVTGYKVYRADASTSNRVWTVVGTVNARTLGFTDATANTGTDYYYSVSAVDGAGNEGLGADWAQTKVHAIDNLAPAAPTLSAAAGVEEVTLSWTPSDPDVRYYVVYRDGEEQSWLPASAFIFRDSNLVGDVGHSYQVRAQDRNGNKGPLSDSVSSMPTRCSLSGTLVDKGFDAVAAGEPLDSEWTVVGEPAVADYSNSRPNAVGQLGTASGHLASGSGNPSGISTEFSPLTSNRAELRFWVNRSRGAVEVHDANPDPSARAFSIRFDQSGYISAYSQRAAEGFASDTSVPLGRIQSWGWSPSQAWTDDWREYRIVLDFTHQTYELSDGFAGVWSPLKAEGAPDWSIPMSGAGDVTAVAGIEFDLPDPDSEVFIDDVRYSDGGINTVRPVCDGYSSAADHPGDTGGTVDVQWPAASDDVGVKSYRIVRNATFNRPETAVTVNAPTTTYTDSGLLNGENYYHTVYALDAAGNASWYTTWSGATPRDNIPPTAPTVTVKGGHRQVTLRWNANTEPDFSDYKVYRDGRCIVFADGTEFTDTGLADGTTYVYEVVARDTANNEARSDPQGVTTDLATGSLVDHGFDWGWGDLDAGVWANNGTPQAREYSWVHAKVGPYAARIQGPTTAANAGVCETTTAGMTSNGAELRFWLYFDTTNQSRLLDDFAPGVAAADRADCIQFASDGTIKAQTDRTSIAGYPAGVLTTVGSYSTGWTEFRIVYTFTGAGAQTYTLSKRSASTDPWTPLKSASASGNNIPFRGTNTITQTHGTLWRCYNNAQMWLDQLLYASSGVSTDVTPPSQPSNLVGTDIHKEGGRWSCDLSWSPATDNVAVTGYKVNRKWIYGWETVGMVPPGMTTFTDWTAEPLQHYEYSISAVDAAGNESIGSSFVAVSVGDTAPPSAPASLSIVDHPNDQGRALDMTWSPALDDKGVWTYKIYYRNAGDGNPWWSYMYLVDGPEYTFPWATTGTPMEFYVVAVDYAYHESPPSPIATATALDNLTPSSPSGIAVTGAPDRVVVSWTANSDPDIAHYVVYRDGTRFGTVSGIETTLTDREVRFGTSAIYQVSAVDWNGNESEKSAPVVGMPQVTPQLAAGAQHTVGLKSDGHAVAAGDNSYGESSLSDWSEVVAVAAGGHHTVGLKSDGTVVVNGFQALGQANVFDWAGVKGIAAGFNHTVGVRTDGTVVATGSNSFGECEVSGWSDITTISAGNYHTVGVKSDGTVVATGSNDQGQCEVSGWSDITTITAGDYHTVGLRSDNTVVATGSNGFGECDVADWSKVVAVEAGLEFTVGLRANGTVVATGMNDRGQCDVSGWSGIVAIAAGQDFTVGLKSDGTVISTGSNDQGQRDVAAWALFSATPLTPDTTAPSAPGAWLRLDDHLADQGGAIDLEWSPATDDVGVTRYVVHRGTSAGTYDTMWAVTGATSCTDGTAVTDTDYYYAISAVDAAGNESALGPEGAARAVDNLAPAAPADVSATSGTNKVTLTWTANSEPDLAGYDVYRDGTKLTASLLAAATYADEGLSDTASHDYQVAAVDSHGNQTLSAVVTCSASRGFVTTPTVSAGGYHSVGLKSDGTVVATGLNDAGQCDVSSWTGISGIAAGSRHTVGLKPDGTAVAVGSNSNGQCDVSGWTDVVEVAAGQRHTVGLTKDGHAVAAGPSGSLQCELWSFMGWDNLVAIAAGGEQSVGLRADGTVIAAGPNYYGECDTYAWSNITAIAAGAEHTVGLTGDRHVVAIGNNLYGQCDVSGWSDIVAISAGKNYTAGLKSDGTVVVTGFATWPWSGITRIAVGSSQIVGLTADGRVVANYLMPYAPNGQTDVAGWNLGLPPH